MRIGWYSFKLSFLSAFSFMIILSLLHPFAVLLPMGIEAAQYAKQRYEI